jgi:hypothetical protein
MSKRMGYPKPSASNRTLRRWKLRAKIYKSEVKLAKLEAYEQVNGTIE